MVCPVGYLYDTKTGDLEIRLCTLNGSNMNYGRHPNLLDLVLVHVCGEKSDGKEM